MQSEIVPYGGWEKNLRLSNDSIELIATLEVGPRILYYRLLEGKNVFKNYPEELGGSEENEWKIRGGHRLWSAPEHREITYHIDNEPVVFSLPNPPSTEAVLTSYQRTPIHLRKEIAITLGVSSSRVSLRHTLTNEGSTPFTVAPWALSVMVPGGTEIIPQPSLGKHPQDLLPNRSLILWPYTDLTDPRWRWGTKYWTLRQTLRSLPTKLGLAHRAHWIGYCCEDFLFLKDFIFEEGASYPDGGCNFETFTNSDMLEIESLGPLSTLSPGKSVSLLENWHLFPMKEPLSLQSEEELEKELSPFLQQAGLQ